VRADAGKGGDADKVLWRYLSAFEKCSGLR